jgi:hypothetical protein
MPNGGDETGARSDRCDEFGFEISGIQNVEVARARASDDVGAIG